ncbi:hypothetical protein Nepgr_022357 [Nepenthes gracilis]|uniref:Uncharacterized protein n=1 Tax=Nepenthes gracilis TaxID=150966 RepID=A0AAD3T0P0_NEPGR|nr:hypothetical protein Nepgr_022357 [Nepenthes gracilis]
MASKWFGNLDKLERSCALKRDGNLAFVVGMLKVAEAVTVTTPKSVLAYVSGKKAAPRGRGWSLIGKLVQSKYALRDAEEGNNEVESINGVL